MRDKKVFDKSVEVLERRFGIGVESVMNMLAGIVNHEMTRVANSYQQERVEPLENLYFQIAHGGEKIAKTAIKMGPRDKKLVAEYMARGLNASIGKSLPMFALSAPGGSEVSVHSRVPHINLTMWWFYEQRDSIGGGGTALKKPALTYDPGGVIIKVEQPVKLDYW